jgi:hypothetical protein
MREKKKEEKEDLNTSSHNMYVMHLFKLIMRLVRSWAFSRGGGVMGDGSPHDLFSLGEMDFHD